MPVITDEEYEEFRRLKQGGVSDREWQSDPQAAYLKALDNIPDGDKQSLDAVTARYNAVVDPQEEPGERTPDEEEEAQAAFLEELDSVEDGDKNAMNELLAKHGMTPRTEG